MRQNLYQYAPTFPWIGLLLLAAGFVIYLITRRLEMATNLLLAGGALLLLLYAVLRPDDVRRMMSGRQARYGSSTFLSILFFTAIAVLLYWVAYQNSNWRWDTTETGEFTPLPETKAVLRTLDEPVHVIAFYPPNLAFQEQQARTILDGLAAESGQFTYEFVDPEINPLRAQQYDLNFAGTLVFTKGDHFTKANSLSDRDIHAALVQVINPVDKKAYFLTGHGELGIEEFGPDGLNTAVRVITDLGFTAEPLSLFTTGVVPEDATVLAIIDPQGPLAAEEVAAVRQYLAGGGALFLIRDIIESESRLQADADGLNEMLRQDWGFDFRPDVIIDQDLAQAGQTFGLSFLGAEYGFSPIITQDLRRAGTRFELARSIAIEPREDIDQMELVRTSSDAWGETDFGLLAAGFAQPDPEVDATGPLAIGVSGENWVTGARVVLFGDSSFVTNQYLFLGGNYMLFSNAMNWLAEDEVAIDLTPRDTVERRVVIPQTQLGWLQLVGTCLGPFLALVAGVAVWYSRRSRR